MEVKVVAITPHALLTVSREFEYLKENTSLVFAYKFRDKFVEVISSLGNSWPLFPECRLLPTKNKIYRNAIWRDYLFVYKIMKEKILVLGVFHSPAKSGKAKTLQKD